MRKINYFLTFFFLIANIIYSQVNPNEVFVEGYVKSNGTIVQPHFRTAPNSTNLDNFSTIPNINPHTLEPGYISPDSKINNINSLISIPENTYNNYNTDFNYLKTSDLKTEYSNETERILEDIRNQTNTYNYEKINYSNYSDITYNYSQDTMNYENNEFDSGIELTNSNLISNSSLEDSYQTKINSTNNEYNNYVAESNNSYDNNGNSSFFPTLISIIFIVFVIFKIISDMK